MKYKRVSKKTYLIVKVGPYHYRGMSDRPGTRKHLIESSITKSKVEFGHQQSPKVSALSFFEPGAHSYLQGLLPQYLLLWNRLATLTAQAYQD